MKTGILLVFSMILYIFAPFITPAEPVRNPHYEILEYSMYEYSSVYVEGYYGAEKQTVEFGYAPDGTAPVFDGSVAVFPLYGNTPRDFDISENGEFGEYPVRFAGNISIYGLSLGYHKITVYAKYDDGSVSAAFIDGNGVRADLELYRYTEEEFAALSQKGTDNKLLKCTLDRQPVLVSKVMYFEGVCGCTAEVTAVGASVDGGAPVFDGMIATRPLDTSNYLENDKILSGYYGDKPVHFSGAVRLYDYKPGYHKIKLVAKLKDGSYSYLLDSDGYTGTFIGFSIPGIKGDANGDGYVNNKDVVTVFRCISGVDYDYVDIIQCDPNNDGYINNKDSILIFRYVSEN